MSIDKIKRLQEKAMLFRLLLEYYAKMEDWKIGDLRDLRRRHEPLFEQIEHGKAIPPLRYDYSWCFF